MALQVVHLLLRSEQRPSSATEARADLPTGRAIYVTVALETPQQRLAARGLARAELHRLVAQADSEHRRVRPQVLLVRVVSRTQSLVHQLLLAAAVAAAAGVHQVALAARAAVAQAEPGLIKLVSLVPQIPEVAVAVAPPGVSVAVQAAREFPSFVTQLCRQFQHNL